MPLVTANELAVRAVRAADAGVSLVDVAGELHLELAALLAPRTQ